MMDKKIVGPKEKIGDTKATLIDLLKKESIYLLGLFAVSIIIFQIVFYKESFLVILKVLASFYWLFILPGFSIMYYWHNALNFLERFVIGSALSGAVIGIASYYLGMAGFHVKYHGYVLPVVMLLFGVSIVWKNISFPRHPLSQPLHKQTNDEGHHSKDENSTN